MSVDLQTDPNVLGEDLSKSTDNRPTERVEWGTGIGIPTSIVPLTD